MSSVNTILLTCRELNMLYKLIYNDSVKVSVSGRNDVNSLFNNNSDIFLFASPRIKSILVKTQVYSFHSSNLPSINRFAPNTW